MAQKIAPLSIFANSVADTYAGGAYQHTYQISLRHVMKLPRMAGRLGQRAECVFADQKTSGVHQPNALTARSFRDSLRTVELRVDRHLLFKQ
jgi:hypothetical protein